MGEPRQKIHFWNFRRMVFKIGRCCMDLCSIFVHLAMLTTTTTTTTMKKMMMIFSGNRELLNICTFGMRKRFNIQPTTDFNFLSLPLIPFVGFFGSVLRFYRKYMSSLVGVVASHLCIRWYLTICVCICLTCTLPRVCMT